MSFLERIKHLLGTRAAEREKTVSPTTISCEEALSVIYEFIDGELEDVTHDLVMTHFEVCVRCYPKLQLERSFLATVQKAAKGEKAPPELKAKLLGLLEEAGRE